MADDPGFAECANRYASSVGKSVAELQAGGVWPRRCRCKPESDNPHCGGFYMYRGYMDGQVYRSIPLTSAHDSGTFSDTSA